MDCVVSPVLGFLPSHFSADDVNLSTKTTVDFVDSLFSDPENVPFSFKTSWHRIVLLQSPKVFSNVLSR